MFNSEQGYEKYLPFFLLFDYLFTSTYILNLLLSEPASFVMSVQLFATTQQLDDYICTPTCVHIHST